MYSINTMLYIYVYINVIYIYIHVVCINALYSNGIYIYIYTHYTLQGWINGVPATCP